MTLELRLEHMVDNIEEVEGANVQLPLLVLEEEIEEGLLFLARQSRAPLFKVLSHAQEIGPLVLLIDTALDHGHELGPEEGRGHLL